MAYMDLNTFEIWAESNIAGFHDEHVEIDELIAPIIRELNLKGYKTKFCCSGHPYLSMNEAFACSEEVAKCIAGLVKTEVSEQDDFPIRALYIASDDDLYITFDGISRNDFSVPLPDGFWWDDEYTIRYGFSTAETYELLSERLGACKNLYQWAKGMAPRKKIIDGN